MKRTDGSDNAIYSFFKFQIGHYACMAKNCMGVARSEAELTIADIEAQLTEEEMREAVAAVSASTSVHPQEPPVFKKGLCDIETKLCEPMRLSVHSESSCHTDEVTQYKKGKDLVYDDDDDISMICGLLGSLRWDIPYNIDVKMVVFWCLRVA
jgi:hypothetical protein